MNASGGSKTAVTARTIVVEKNFLNVCCFVEKCFCLR